MKTSTSLRDRAAEALVKQREREALLGQQESVELQVRREKNRIRLQCMLLEICQIDLAVEDNAVQVEGVWFFVVDGAAFGTRGSELRVSTTNPLVKKADSGSDRERSVREITELVNGPGERVRNLAELGKFYERIDAARKANTIEGGK
jgi:hypothetical protein